VVRSSSITLDGFLLRKRDFLSPIIHITITYIHDIAKVLNQHSFLIKGGINDIRTFNKVRNWDYGNFGVFIVFVF